VPTFGAAIAIIPFEPCQVSQAVFLGGKSLLKIEKGKALEFLLDNLYYCSP